MVELYLVTTPIGNLEDITLRAKSLLEESSLIFAEDTRSTRSLLELLGISAGSKKILSFHDHNKQKIEDSVKLVKNSSKAVIVSDAGSPIISDPAFPLVRACIEDGIKICSAPGATSVITALELSGLPPQPFTFHGFLGRKKGEITDKLNTCEGFGGTHIFFESPHRISSTLELIKEEFPSCEVALCREITKKFESVYRFKASDIDLEQITQKGEFVLLVHFPKSSQNSTGTNKSLNKLAENYIKKKTPKNLSKLLAEVLGVSVNEAYDLLSK